MQEQPLHIDWERLIELLEKQGEEQHALVGALSPDEQALFAQLQELRNDPLLTGALQLNTVQAWKRGFTPVRSLQWKRWVAAACILLAATGGWFAFHQWRSSTTPSYQNIAQALADHTPSAKVQLVTADGNKVDIDSARVLTEKDGTAIQSQHGAISYLNRNGQASFVQTNAPLLMNTLIIPRGYMYHLTLSDGSKVWLNADSKISFPVHFDKTERKVTIEGEAYFEVAHDKKWPFTVRVNNADVHVLGTSFDVKAYGKNIYTTLITGSVGFSAPVGGEVRLTPGYQAVFNSVEGAIKTRKVEAGDWIAWKDDDLVMVKMTLAELAEVLERRYDVQVSFTEEKLKGIQYNAALHLTGNIVDMLNNLEQTGNIHFAVKDKKILILPANMK